MTVATLLTPTGRATSWRPTIGRATAAVVAIGLLWRVARFLANWPLWGDEAYVAVNLLLRDYAGLARPLEYFQIAPPGFLWAELTMVRIFGPSEWALRLVALISGIASLFLFWWFCSANLGRRTTLMAVGIFSASVYIARHANEVKPYALDLFLALVMTCLARSAWRRPVASRPWIGLAVVGALGVWASYPLIFVAGGLGMVLAWRVWECRPGKRVVLLWVTFVASTLASWATMYLAVARPQALSAPFYFEMQTWESSFPPLGRPWNLPWWLVQVHTGNMLAYPYGGNHFGSLATALLSLHGGFVLWRRDRGLLALLLCPLGPAMIAAALHRYPYGTSARISLFMAPAVCILAGQGLSSLMLIHLPRFAARRLLLVVTIGFAAIAVGCGISAVASPYRSPIDLETKRFVKQLATETRPGDRWIGFNGLGHLPKSKDLMLMPWLQHAAQFHFYAIRDAPVPLDWMPEPRDVVTAQSGRTWFLVHMFGFDGFPGALFHEHVERLVAKLGPYTLERFVTNRYPEEVVYAFIFPAPSDSPR
jgi:hypothetical protein